MKKRSWENRIREYCVNAGTYREYFEPIIETLSLILEHRDKLAKEFKKTKQTSTVVKEKKIKNSKAKKTEIKKNPTLVMIDDLNKTALMYWRELGLTPSALRKIDDELLKPKKKNNFFEVLNDFN